MSKHNFNNIPAADKSAISPLLSYSCRFWADHLVRTPCEKTLMEVVQFVMYDKLLFWMEVMSISGRAHEAVAILKRTLEWPELNVCCSLVCHGTYLIPNNELTIFIHDTLRFVSAFVTPISASAPHIYLSALPFAPEHSLVTQKFSSRFPNTLTVTEGRPAQWPFTLFTAERDKGSVDCLVFSPDEKMFACASYFISVTLKQDILFRVHLSMSTVS